MPNGGTVVDLLDSSRSANREGEMTVDGQKIMLGWVGLGIHSEAEDERLERMTDGEAFHCRSL